jgi:hypothetical protein
MRARAEGTARRLTPARLGDDAKQAARDLATETGERIRQHPFLAAGAALALVAITFNRPLGRIADRLIDKWLPPLDEADEEASEESLPGVADSLHSSPADQNDSLSPTEFDHDRTLD